MSSQETNLGEFELAGDDHVVPFQVEALDARGRAVQLGPILDQILSRHDYPEPVCALLAEAVALTVILGTSLKFDGKFIFQTQSDGPVDMMVVDFATPGSVRAYARFDEEALAAKQAEGRTAPPDLLGKGVLALTIDQGPHMHRYQGIVELRGETLEEAAKSYFRQSEQIPTEIRLSVARLLQRDEEGVVVHHWRAGGVIAQFLPDSADRMRQPDLPGGDDPREEEPSAPQDNADDAWREVQALMETVEASELTDPQVGAERLLYRLFHERGVRVFPASPVADDCSCSRERIRSVLESLGEDDLRESARNGAIEVTCEFCGAGYRFAPDEIAAAGEESAAAGEAGDRSR